MEAAVPVLIRSLAATAAAGAAAALSLVTVGAAVAQASPAAAAAQASPAVGPGLTHKPIILFTTPQLDSYDVATDAAGAAFIGWISEEGPARQIHFCTIRAGASSCAGGVQTIDSLGDSSASGLRVLATASGNVTLVWFHDTTASGSGPEGAEIATATSANGGTLSAATDVAPAPSFGYLDDAEFGPGGAIWTLAETSNQETLQIRAGLGAALTSKGTPYEVSTAKLAFSGSTAVIAIQRGGYITQPVSYAFSKGGGSWSSFRKLNHTWTGAANLGLTGTRSGIRLLASEDDAGYSPVVSRWTGSSFSRPALTGDRNSCAPDSHDPVSDASGRMADVSEECSDLAVANLPDTTHAAVVRFGAGGTFAAGIPQLATTPRGRAWVVWSIQSGTTHKLLVAPVLLPGRDVTVRKSAGRNRVTLTGPASCLPAVTVGVKVTGSAAAHWRVLRRALHLGGTSLGSKLNGGTLTAGHLYTLAGSVTFADGGARRTVTAKLKFRSCPNS
jgi:hypothetical protein